MTLFRKKPVVIDAFLWTGGPDQEEDPIWAVEAMKDGRIIAVPESEGGPAYLSIHTLEGTMIANDGDWIIKGVKGEIYPCKPDIFAMTYDKVEVPE